MVRIPFVENKEFIRGRRAESGIIDWSDCQLPKEEIDKVLEPFAAKGDFSDVKQEICMSSKPQLN